MFLTHVHVIKIPVTNETLYSREKIFFYWVCFWLKANVSTFLGTENNLCLSLNTRQQHTQNKNEHLNLNDINNTEYKQSGFLILKWKKFYFLNLIILNF